MSAIDVQNAKQIRDPMDVLITLSLGNDIAMTYSGYSSAKVADGVLNQSSWPMRGLADLQGNGFPLDGSRVLYDPNTSPSQTNGKLGVRGNVGQPVSVTAKGNDTIAALAISVTGAASVTLSGRTTEITGNRVTLQLLNTTATLTFQPSSEDRRIEIITILPEADFVINNDNLIKATVSLRSDLSIIDPTLPESELNVEVYQDLDISEAVASIPEDTPITYQAGYPGDMSPVRKFYVSGQVTWADNVLNIHAVDAVHFLDWEMRTPLSCPYGARALYLSLGTFLSESGITATIENPGVAIGYDTRDIYNKFVTVPNLNVRGFLAEVSNLFHQDLPNGGAVWMRYVDAGLPAVSISKPTSTRVVNEDDCGAVSKKVETVIRGVKVNHANLFEAFAEVGSGEWTKGVGVSLSFDSDSLTNDYRVGVYVGPTGGEENASKILFFYTQMSSFAGVYAIVPSNKRGTYYTNLPHLYAGDYYTGRYEFERLPVEGITQNDMLAIPRTAEIEAYATYAAFIPWDAYYDPNVFDHFTSQSAVWRDLVSMGILASDAKSMQLSVRGRSLLKEIDEIKVGEYEEGGIELDPLFYGKISTKELNDNNALIFPGPAYESLLKRSNVTCSFTWKGDPRIQPRDVFTFHRLGGTDEEWTFENITITHEGGGTLAEATARKGII